MRTPNYVVGRGKLYFDQFLAGTKTISGNSRYLGNSPKLTSSQSEDKLKHYSSDTGIKQQDAAVSISNDLTLAFSLDDIAPENLAMWYRGAVEKNVLAGGAVVAEAHDAIKLGTYIQLGLSATDPVGAKNVSAVVVHKAAAVIAAAGNYEVDAVTGRVYILDNATDLADDDDITIDYTSAAGTEEVVIAAGTVIEGRLEFMADNAAGENRDYAWPYVQISPNGDFSLKGDGWQEMEFTCEVLKLNDSTERQYIVKR